MSGCIKIGESLNQMNRKRYFTMFSLFKSNPIKKLEVKRSKLLEEAMHIERSGDLKLYAVKMAAIDSREKEIDKLQKGK